MPFEYLKNKYFKKVNNIMELLEVQPKNLTTYAAATSAKMCQNKLAKLRRCWSPVWKYSFKNTIYVENTFWKIWFGKFSLNNTADFKKEKMNAGLLPELGLSLSLSLFLLLFILFFLFSVKKTFSFLFLQIHLFKS